MTGVFFGATVAVKAPEAFVCAFPTCLPPAQRSTVRPATPLPATVSRPETFEPFVASVSGGGAAGSAAASAAAAAFGWPVPGAYGVALRCQTCVPAGTVNAFVSRRVRWTIFSPSGERPAVPAGTSAGGRQTNSATLPAIGPESSCCTPIASGMVTLKTSSVRLQVAVNAVEPAQALAASPTVVVPSGVVGDATRIVPSSGRVEPRRSAATPVPVAMPTTEPTVVGSFALYVAGGLGGVQAALHGDELG